MAYSAGKGSYLVMHWPRRFGWGVEALLRGPLSGGRRGLGARAWRSPGAGVGFPKVFRVVVSRGLLVS